MRYISLFSGIEATTCAWEPLGWEAVAFSEIEPFPCELLNQRFPHVPNLGDITQIDWSAYVGAVDVVVGGSPCQSFSVAGKREGLKGKSGLMLEYIRAIREIMPACFVWENVPGALSSEWGAAFGQLLHSLDECGYGMAWRVLDAQFFGVPQRRRRVFLVGCLGDPECAAKVLFDDESMQWDFASSREKREELTRGIKACPGASCKFVIQGDIARWSRFGQNGDGYNNDDVCYTLNTLDTPAVCIDSTTQDQSSHCYALQGSMIGRSDDNGPQGDGVNEDVSFTLNTIDRHAVAICVGSSGSFGSIDEDLSGTLTCRHQAPFIAQDYVVRTLTPLECERLQGFPDGWTDIRIRGKPASDAARYKALGNSMAVPVMRWIGERIEQFLPGERKVKG